MRRFRLTAASLLFLAGAAAMSGCGDSSPTKDKESNDVKKDFKKDADVKSDKEIKGKSPPAKGSADPDSGKTPRK